jgi:predicted outer membrane repeat protein
MAFGNKNIKIVSSHFENNFAGHLGGGGGAIYMNTSNSNIVIQDCLFNESYGAKFGGSVLRWQ